MPNFISEDQIERAILHKLFRLLDDAIAQGMGFCREREIEIPGILESPNVFRNIGLFNAYADTLLGNEEWRRTLNVYENTISSLYEACKPEVLGRDTVRLVAVFQYLRGVIESIVDRQDIDAVSLRIGELLDESVVVDKPEEFIAAHGKPTYQIVQTGKTWDLSKIDFAKLKEDFRHTPYKNIAIGDREQEHFLCVSLNGANVSHHHPRRLRRSSQ